MGAVRRFAQSGPHSSRCGGRRCADAAARVEFAATIADNETGESHRSAPRAHRTERIGWASSRAFNAKTAARIVRSWPKARAVCTSKTTSGCGAYCALALNLEWASGGVHVVEGVVAHVARSPLRLAATDLHQRRS